MNEMLNRILNNWDIFGFTTGTVWITALSVVLASLLIYFIISRLLIRTGRRSPENLFGTAWLKFRYPVLFLILLIDFIILQGLFTPGKEISLFTGYFIKLSFIFIITWFLIRSINSLADATGDSISLRNLSFVNNAFWGERASVTPSV